MSSNPPSLTEQRRFWDWHWERWQERSTINDWKNRRHEMVLRLVASLRGERLRLLDLGCGPGWYTEKLARFGEVTGIDLSDEAINLARSLYPGIAFIAGSLYDVPIPAQHFDVVVSQEVIDHVEDAPALLDRAADALKPGGHLILSCANRFVMDRLENGEFPAQPPEHISRYRSAGEWRRLLSRRFEVLEIRSILPVVGRRGVLRVANSTKVNAVLAALIGHDRLTTLKERAGLGYTLIVLARRAR
jgi:SAM-dependent methyltransferase